MPVNWNRTNKWAAFRFASSANDCSRDGTSSSGRESFYMTARESCVWTYMKPTYLAMFQQKYKIFKRRCRSADISIAVICQNKNVGMLHFCKTWIKSNLYMSCVSYQLGVDWCVFFQGWYWWSVIEKTGKKAEKKWLSVSKYNVLKLLFTSLPRLFSIEIKMQKYGYR